jgi:Na+-transporting methylmalonyl-CoA/oxaloacetate decarboxylase beta subunit
MKILSLFTLSGFAALTKGNIIILLVGGVLLLYLAIAKKFEPLLLLPIGFGAVLVNLPLAGLMEEGGLLLPPSVPIIGMLMLGNLFRESLVVNRLSNTA